MMHALKAAEYWDFVTGDADTGSQGYESKKQKAFSSVLQCIGQKNISAVMNCADPKELWDMLYQLFERDCQQQCLYLDAAVRAAHEEGDKTSGSHTSP